MATRAALSVPAHEAEVIEAVGAKYKLTPEQLKLLYAIRLAENGKTGREFGVLAPEAMRFANNPELSFPTQAAWAAGTIKKRYTGDLQAFAKRWAPIGVANDPNNLNQNWVKNVQYYMGDSNGG